jgi:cysteine-rich repeat protein
MRHFYGFFLALLVAAPATAVDLVCTVPDAGVARAQELCTVLRTRARVRAADWTNTVCVNEVVRIGLLAVEHEVSTIAAKAARRAMVTDATNAFKANYPSALPAPVECGDGTLDAEFGEECDDGNTESGDGCDAGCALE